MLSEKYRCKQYKYSDVRHIFLGISIKHIYISNAKHILMHTYIYVCVVSRRSITPQHIKYNSKPLDVVDSLYYGNKLPSLTNAYCRRNIKIVLHPTALSYI